jgi:phosphoglycerate dehydrogenase-like enzyme
MAQLPSHRAAEPPSRRVLIAHRLAPGIAEGIAAARPDLELRPKQLQEVTEEDLSWADTLVGFKRPPGLGSVTWVHSIGAGVDGFLSAVPSSRRSVGWPEGVLLTRASEPFGPQMGEYVVARVLAVCQHLSRFAEDQRARRWTPLTPRRAAGTRAVVVGTGEVGTGIARALEAIGVEVTGVSRSGRSPEPPSRLSVLPSSRPVSALPTLVPHADWIVLAAPLTRESRGMIGRDLLRHCRGAWLINVARGGLVDEAALVEALDDGRLGGAALDVFEQEPLPADSPLWSRPDVIISPHVAGVTTVEGAVAGFLECLESLERGETPRWAVDPERGY